ncbi:MAG: exodeoxyribonuclease III [Candidatus Zeuxoniibacter abyssi]|nr:MAG: exodeoxyribonuclease III [Candidatus Persebacteraceae bacterium AB1(2)]
MKIAAWNVNSVRARLPHILRWLAECAPEVLLLQETKSVDDTFPFTELAEAGYETAHYGQRAYNGVAVLSRLAMSEVEKGMPERADDPQARIIAATVTPPAGEAIRLISVYVPNGQSLDSDKYEYKLRWLEHLKNYLSVAQECWGRVAVCGDYNIAPADADIYDPEEWGEAVLASSPERAALSEILALGYKDAHRLFEQPEGVFSWWDYRAAAFRRNRGLRIDLILLSRLLAPACLSCAPDKTPRGWERPSDHAPVAAKLAV